MYAVYNYAAGSTQANVLSDLIKLITGETNKANLSANCVQANTSITSTVAAGWTVWDAAAGTNQQVVRALCQDGTTYKYYRLNFSSTTAFAGSIAEAWNDTAHTGTNVYAAGGSTWNATAGGYFYLYVTPRNILIVSYSSSTWQNTPGNCHEVTRDTIPSSYPPFICPASSSAVLDVTAYFTRSKSATGTGDVLTTSTTSRLAWDGVVGTPGGYFDFTYRDASENVLAAVYPLAVSGYVAAMSGAKKGRLYDILGVGQQSGFGTNLDEFSYGGKTYVLFRLASTQYGMAVPKE